MFEKLKISIAKLLLMQKIKLALIHSVRLKKKIIIITIISMTIAVVTVVKIIKH